jgi:hypothetical protein
MNVYALKYWSVDLNEDKRRIDYPILASESTLGYFSSIKLARSAIKASLQEWITDAHHFRIETIVLDKPYGDCDEGTTIYNNKGNFIGQIDPEEIPFLGVPSEACRYKKGDFVEFIYNDKLQLGVIYSQPPSPEQLPFDLDQSDNCYLVNFDLDNHAHIPEALLFKLSYPLQDFHKEVLLKRL